MAEACCGCQVRSRHRVGSQLGIGGNGRFVVIQFHFIIIVGKSCYRIPRVVACRNGDGWNIVVGEFGVVHVVRPVGCQGTKTV